jgi:hypothetical protein
VGQGSSSHEISRQRAGDIEVRRIAAKARGGYY